MLVKLRMGTKHFALHFLSDPSDIIFMQQLMGKLGGIMKVYRDWHIYGNDEWLKLIYSYVQNSLDYCINTWDPKRKGCYRGTSS